MEYSLTFNKTKADQILEKFSKEIPSFVSFRRLQENAIILSTIDRSKTDELIRYYNVLVSLLASTNTSPSPENRLPLSYSFNPDYLNLFNDKLGIMDEGLRKLVLDSLNRCQSAFRQFRFEGVAFCFNGGKDCTVLLHLLQVSMLREFGYVKPLKTVYIVPPNSFDEIENFSNECSRGYSLDFSKYSWPIKQGLFDFMASNPNIKAIFAGTRRSDPYSSHLDYLTPTDAGWPCLIRIGPLLDWKYENIWSYLKEFQVPYCSLYDMGYTSIGSKHNTIPNPLLKCADSFCGYLEAYKLVDDGSGFQERKSRV